MKKVTRIKSQSEISSLEKALMHDDGSAKSPADLESVNRRLDESAMEMEYMATIHSHSGQSAKYFLR